MRGRLGGVLGDHVIAFGFDTNFDTDAPNRLISTEIDLFGTSVWKSQMQWNSSIYGYIWLRGVLCDK